MANEILKEMKKTTKYNALAPLNYSMSLIKEEKGKELKEMEDVTFFKFEIIFWRLFDSSRINR